MREMGGTFKCQALVYKSAQASIFHRALASPLYVWVAWAAPVSVAHAYTLVNPMICAEFIHLPMAASSPSMPR